jgi:hypothetical protein
MIEEIPLQGGYTGVSGSRWDLALVGIFGVAILGGLLIAAGKALGQGDAAPSAVAVATASASAQGEPTVEPTPDAWLVNAVDHRGAIGQRFTYRCPPNGAGSHITGTGTYTDDSSVCSAAVHAGVITFEEGGTVVIEIRPGQNGYLGSMQNRIASFHLSTPGLGSFVVVGASTPAWAMTAVEHRGAIGRRFTYECPAHGDAYAIWGTGTYTDDSSICTAAVHRGVISFTHGGVVTIEIRPGQNGYLGSMQNRIASFHLSRPGLGSFVVVGASTPAWAMTAVEHRGAIGQQFTYECPAHGDAYAIWGTGTYTDDSSICTAAVHRGLISFTHGGVVTIEIRPGRARYQRTYQNGISSSHWGQWDGSFGIVHGHELPY